MPEDTVASIESTIAELRTNIKDLKEKCRALEQKQDELFFIILNDKRPFWKKFFSPLPEKNKLKQYEEETEGLKKKITSCEKEISRNQDIITFMRSQ